MEFVLKSCCNPGEVQVWLVHFFSFIFQKFWGCANYNNLWLSAGMPIKWRGPLEPTFSLGSWSVKMQLWITREGLENLQTNEKPYQKRQHQDFLHLPVPWVIKLLIQDISSLHGLRKWTETSTSINEWDRAEHIDTLLPRLFLCARPNLQGTLPVDALGFYQNEFQHTCHSPFWYTFSTSR